MKSDESVEQKRRYVRDVFDEIDLDKGVTESLDCVLANPLSVEAWRRAAIEQPEVIQLLLGTEHPVAFRREHLLDAQNPDER